MSLTTPERAKIVVRYLAKKAGITQEKFGERIGYTNKSALSSVLNGHKVMPRNFLDKLLTLDPEINPDFLYGTSDEMLRKGNTQPDIPEVVASQAQPKPQPAAVQQSGVYIPLEDFLRVFSELSATVRSQQETIRRLIGEKEV